MIQRNRAWRRKKARLVMTKIKETKDWLVGQIKDRKKPLNDQKRHAPGKLTKRQKLRAIERLNSEMSDALTPSLSIDGPIIGAV